MTKYVIAFWYRLGGAPDVIAERVGGNAEWSMDNAFKYMMGKLGVSFVMYATFTLYNQKFPEGISSYRRGLALENTVYSYADEGVPS